MIKRKSLLILLIIILLLITSCSNNNKVNNGNMKNETDTTDYYTFMDSLKKAVKLKNKPDKVIALMGSYAETWLLAGGKLAGVTDDVISERKMKLPEDTKIVGTYKDPNLEEILSLNPDFILLSPDIKGHVELSETLNKAKIPHGYFKVEEFHDYLNMLKICTDLTGNKDMFEKNGLDVKKQIDDVKSKIKMNQKQKPSILFIRAFSSGAKALAEDNMTSMMLEELGTVNIATKHKSLLDDLSIEEIIEEDPDFIFVVTMGDSDKAIKTLKNGIEKNPAWSNLTAVKNGKYIVLPKELFHYKPNARWGESYEYLAKILYPEKFK